MKKIITGNEAIAGAARMAGVKVATGYPGTPATEILENVAGFPEIQAEWCPNEKVALEVASGASMAGGRALTAMKHVGLNVAADPLLSLSYSGVGAGLVIVSADDPGMYSSQNEQDNRWYAKFAKVPLLEPADSQEAFDFTILAFEISEKFDTPVILRTTTRISHTATVVEVPPIPENQKNPTGFLKNPPKYVLLPAYARQRHLFVEERLKKLGEFSETTEINQAEITTGEIGFITSGLNYQYLKEVLPEAPVFKLGLSYPPPIEKIKKFAASFKKIFVLEELDDFLFECLTAGGLQLTPKPPEFCCDELSIERIREILNKWGVLEHNPKKIFTPLALPARPPVLCAGCSHRGIFYLLNKLKLNVTGDIGCYTLGALPPLNALDTCTCMGAGINQAHGIGRITPQKKNTVAVIGDSTFIHSGITGLINCVYNQGKNPIVILDNSTTAMTGGQDHPGSGKTLKETTTHQLDLVALGEACGVKYLKIVNPYNLKETEKIIKEFLNLDEPSVIISRAPCIVTQRVPFDKKFRLNQEKCQGCDLCLKLGCPAIIKEEKKISLDEVICINCGLCFQVCPSGAIEEC
jgi:indolepyruvate ferredoxin oxidoreductase alpha subunit